MENKGAVMNRIDPDMVIKITAVILNLLVLLIIIAELNTVHFLKNIVKPKVKTAKSLQAEVGSIEYYRLYKYIYLQSKIGARPFDTLCRLHRVCTDRNLRNVMFEMSVIISHSNDIDRGVEFIRKALRGDGSLLFISIIENSTKTGFSTDAMRRLDGMLFQKYILEIKASVKKKKRRYFWASLMFCSAVFVAIFMPTLSQMVESLKLIFASY